MDRAIVLSVLLLVGLTWLLYKLTALLEPRADKPASSAKEVETSPESQSYGRRKPIHQRLRK